MLCASQFQRAYNAMRSDGIRVNRKEILTLLKNALANVVRGCAAAVVAIILPPFLARLMSPSAFGAWLLILQLSALVGYLDFGIQTAVGRFVAHANEKGDAEHRDRIINTSLFALTVAGAMAIAASLAMALLLPNIFRQIPSNLIGDVRVALVLVASSLAIGLPASVFNGIFIGLQRYEVPAVIIGGSRILSAILLILVVKHGGDLARMGLVLAAVNLASYGLQFLMYRKMVSNVHFSPRLVSRGAGRELFDCSLSLTVWSFAMLLITGLDVTLVGYFQIEAVAYYAVPATLITFLSGLQSALFGVMIPSTAALQARGDSRGLGHVTVTATRYGTFLLLLTGLPLILGARSILTLWMGPAYGVHGARILQLLVAANIIRLSATPFSMTLVGTGQQRLAIVTALLEGFSNLLASIVAGYMFGALGVAIGTLVGSMVGVTGNFLYNMPRTVGLGFGVSSYLRDGLMRPVICGVPLALFAILIRSSNSYGSIAIGLGLVGTLAATVILVWRWGLVGLEREKLLARRLVSQA
jgi:O-antigen/teichoic acid export membrane protein